MTGHPRRAWRHLRARWRLARGSGPVRLHLGCGQRRLDGFVNIDHLSTSATDYVGDITSLPCRAGSVDRIETYHVIEHLPRPAVEAVLDHWLRLLKPGGTLVLECPDFEADIRDYLSGNEERLYSIFGRQRFEGDAHHWGYTAKTLGRLLKQVGYTGVREVEATDYHTKFEPCIRIEAQAP